jgi:hypothetical protein
MPDQTTGREFMIATFADEQSLRDAVRTVRDRGLRVFDVYTPYPVAEIEEALELRASRIPVVTLIGGVAGLVGALALEYYTAVFDWPLNVGGKPDNSLLAFIPIAFELTILSAGLATVAAFLLRCGLWPSPRPSSAEEGATDDVFALVMRCRQTAFERASVERILVGQRATSVVWKVLDL